VSKDYVTLARRALKPQLDPVCRRRRMIAATVACSTSSASAGSPWLARLTFRRKHYPCGALTAGTAFSVTGTAGGVVVVDAACCRYAHRCRNFFHVHW